ncbi:hypothetical protein ALP54_200017 [Pseudomonas amygdali pv. lachrymans]|nr:hypothetical protein ALP54_200017 [Pseudomonas amygdali pv. lachrymans]
MFLSVKATVLLIFAAFPLRELGIVLAFFILMVELSLGLQRAMVKAADFNIVRLMISLLKWIKIAFPKLNALLVKTPKSTLM